MNKVYSYSESGESDEFYMRPNLGELKAVLETRLLSKHRISDLTPNVLKELELAIQEFDPSLPGCHTFELVTGEVIKFHTLSNSKS